MTLYSILSRDLCIWGRHAAPSVARHRKTGTHQFSIWSARTSRMCGVNLPSLVEGMRLGQGKSDLPQRAMHLRTRIVDRRMTHAWPPPSSDVLCCECLSKSRCVLLHKLDGKPGRLATALRPRKCALRPSADRSLYKIDHVQRDRGSYPQPAAGLIKVPGPRGITALNSTG
jgi:hypothetical protein